jgi:SAM-dependent methyltransferase
MLRAIAKGAGLLAFGRLPGGATLYRKLTREIMGTKATHVDKLKRVLPGYVRVWKELCGLEMEGKDVWIHEAGWTPYSGLANYLLTGKAGILTNTHARVLDRYLSRAVNGVLATDLPRMPANRLKRLEAVRWQDDACLVLESLDGRVVQAADPVALSLDSASVDLVHSGGALEHYPPGRLGAFLRECHRILRSGGVMSHVFDHRDHLHHADPRLPFLAHLALPDPVYRLLCAHPLGYHNRLSPTRVVGMLEEAGFEPVAVRRMALPQGGYVTPAEVLQSEPGLLPAWLSPAHRNLSALDLRTAAAHYLFRKP